MRTMPPRSDGEAWQVQYCVSGGEAVEMAIQLARVTTGHLDLCDPSPPDAAQRPCNGCP